jgi:hypothetical protein
MKELLRCVACGKSIWRRKLKKGEIDSLGRNLCQECKNKVRMEVQRNRNKVYRVDESVFQMYLKKELDKLARKQKLKEEREKVKKNE